MVLFGDSHATMWFPAVDACANQNGDRLYVWTKATCPPVDISFFSPVLGRTFNEYANWRTQIMARIATLHPNLVILGIAPGYNPAHHIVQNGPKWLAGLASTISAIRSCGSAVVVIGPIPSPPGDIPDCLSQGPPTSTSAPSSAAARTAPSPSTTCSSIATTRTSPPIMPPTWPRSSTTD